MRVTIVILVLLLAGIGATYARYESLSPCIWMEKDLAARTGLPGIIVKARIQAAFLLRGIAEPDAYECLTEWWSLRSEGLPEEP